MWICCLIVVLIYIYLTIDFEQLYTCLLAIHMFSLEKSLLKSFVHFLIEQFFLLFFSCKVSVYILSRTSYMTYKYFLPVCGLSFHFFMMSFKAQKFLSFGGFCFWPCHIVKAWIPNNWITRRKKSK